LDKGSDDLQTQHERHASTGTTGREEKVLGHGFMGEENTNHGPCYVCYGLSELIECQINSVSTAP